MGTQDKQTDAAVDADLAGEVERCHWALAALRKLALEKSAVTPGDVVEVIGQSGVDTSDFARLAAGV